MHDHNPALTAAVEHYFSALKILIVKHDTVSAETERAFVRDHIRPLYDDLCRLVEAEGCETCKVFCHEVALLWDEFEEYPPLDPRNLSTTFTTPPGGH